MVRGAYRLHGTKVKERPLPITLLLLKGILAAMAAYPRDFGGDRAATALRAAFALAFACFILAVKFTHNSGEFDPRFHLSRGSVSWSPPTLTIPASKGDPFRVGVPVAIPDSGTSCCPVRLLHDWLRLNPSAGPSEPLFSLPGGAFPATAVTNALATGLRIIGSNPKGFTGHSFRHGAATWAKSIGIPASEVQLLGRWAGSSFRTYLAPGRAPHMVTARRLLTSRASDSSLPASGIPRLADAWNSDDDRLAKGADDDDDGTTP